jgi:hypothetical protein
MLAVASSPRGSKTALTGAATLSQAHLIQRGLGTGGRTPGKILLSRVLTATPATSCRTPVVQTNDVWLWVCRRLPVAKQTQDGIAATAHAQLASQVFPYLTPCGESQLAERFLQPLGALSVRAAEIGKSFHENLLSTGALCAEKATDMHDETDGTPNRGQITERACIVALDARRCRLTEGAESRWGHGSEGQGDLLSYLYPFHFDAGKIEKNDQSMRVRSSNTNKDEKMFNFLCYHILGQQSCVRFRLSEKSAKIRFLMIRFLGIWDLLA